MFYRLILLYGLIFLMLGICSAQSGVASGNPLSGSNAARRASDENRDDDDIRIGRPEDEMIRKRQIEFAKKNYQEHLDRAHETAILGSSLLVNYAKKKTLDKEDYKKLERLGKLAKKVREQMSEESEAGTLTETPPESLEKALTRLDKAAQELDKLVKETPRQVISATVIDQACEVEALVKYIKVQWPENKL